MNILLANWSWYPSGGDWTYIKSISELYESKGHKIVPFSMKNEKNIENYFEKFFISGLDYNELNSNRNIYNSYKAITKTIYSFESKKNLQKLLLEQKIDVAQLNSITNSITPSIIPVLKRNRIPIVWRILDYKIICPNAYLFVNGNICKACKGQKFYNCVKNKCKKNSLLPSVLASLGAYLYSVLPIYNYVDLFLFQSEFTRDIFVEFGFDISRTSIIENPYNLSTHEVVETESNYILYFGRIEKEKGIYTLLEAMKFCSNYKLKVVGTGGEFDNMIAYIKLNKLRNVEVLGSVWGEDLAPIIRFSKFVVVPSEWYEPSPYVVLQSFSFGKPVICSNMGGLNDLVINGYNGLIFKSKSVIELVDRIQVMFNEDREIYLNFCRKALETIIEKHNPEKYYSFTIGHFESLIQKRK